MKFILLLAALAVASALPKGETPVNFFALANPVNTSDPNAGYGGCAFWYDVNTMLLTGVCNCWAGSGIIHAHIHGPKPGTNVRWYLAPDPTTGFITPPIVYDPSPATPLTNQEEADLFQANYYVNIHTTAYPAGAFNGYIAYKGSQVTGLFPDYVASLDPAQASTTAAPVTSTHRGGAAIISKTITVFHDFTLAQLSAPGCHIHGPSSGPGNATGILVPLGMTAAACTSPIVVDMSSDTVCNAQCWSYIKAGLTYVNIHTVAYGAGEIRGQLNPISVLTQPIRGAASSVTAGVSVLAAVALAFAARRF